MIIIGLLYGMFLIGLLAIMKVGKEADETMEEMLQIEKANKRVENYYPKKEM